MFSTTLWSLLYKADNFAVNFIKVAILIMLRLIFLASLGIFASSFLSFPVAILLSLAIFCTGTISQFCLESFEYLGENIHAVYYYTVKPIVHLLPQFDKFTPTDFLVPARLLSWPLLANIAVSMVATKAALLLIFALLIFSYREIAKITV